MTTEQLTAAGFEPCSKRPGCWEQDSTTIYTRNTPQGTAYVRFFPGLVGIIEAFVGQWQCPARYCFGTVLNSEHLLKLLA